MTKNDIINNITERVGLNKGDVALIVNETVKEVKAFLIDAADSSSGESLQIIGLGSFTVQERPARRGRNPKTQEKIHIPAKKVAKFKPAKALRDL